MGRVRQRFIIDDHIAIFCAPIARLGAMHRIKFEQVSRASCVRGNLVDTDNLKL